MLDNSIYTFSLYSPKDIPCFTLEDHKIYITPHKTSKYISHYAFWLAVVVYNML